MTPFTANLKQLYQRRAFWLCYLWVGLTCAPVVVLLFHRGHTNLRTPVLALFLLPCLLVPFFLAAHQREILAAPFTFCLPGHAAMPRRFLFTLGVYLTGALALTSLLTSEAATPTTLLVTLAAAASGLCLYLFVCLFMFAGSQWRACLGILFPAAYFFGVFGGWTAVTNTLLQHPVPVLLASAVGVGIAWVRLNPARVARAYCGQRYLGLSAWHSPGKIREYQTRLLAERRPDRGEALGERLWNTFRTWAPGPRRPVRWQYAVGVVYERFGLLFSQRGLSQTVLWMTMLAIFGYWPLVAPRHGPATVSDMFFIMPVIMGTNLLLPVSSTLLLTAGRRERLVGALALAVFATAGTAAALAVFASLTVAVAPAMPTLHTEKLTFTYQAMHLQHLHAAFWTVPLGFAGQLVTTSQIVRMLPFMALLMSCPWWLPALSASSWLVKGGLVAGVWVGFGLLLWHYCTRCNLAGQRSR